VQQNIYPRTGDAHSRTGSQIFQAWGHPESSAPLHNYVLRSWPKISSQMDDWLARLVCIHANLALQNQVLKVAQQQSIMKSPHLSDAADSSQSLSHRASSAVATSIPTIPTRTVHVALWACVSRLVLQTVIYATALRGLTWMPVQDRPFTIQMCSVCQPINRNYDQSYTTDPYRYASRIRLTFRRSKLLTKVGVQNASPGQPWASRLHASQLTMVVGSLGVHAG